MRRTYFADTWFFVAILDRFDSHHAGATRIARALKGARVVTNESVLAEVLAFFARAGVRARGEAAAKVRDALQSLEVKSVDRALFLRALDLYETRSDKQYSLVDCASMVMMRERGISHVLTNDHHFRQEGFTVLSDAP